MINGFEFWKLVDQINPYRSMSGLVKAADLNYNNIKQQRSDCRIPKADDLLKISEATGKSINFLLTGKDDDRPQIKLSEEALFVEESVAMKSLVRFCMNNPNLLQAFELIMNAQKKEILDKII